MNASAPSRQQSPRVYVRRALHSPQGRGRRNWVVYDCRGPKVFIRQFTFSYFSTAVREADRLARTGLINPMALFGAQRVEYTGYVPNPIRGDA